MLRGSGSWPVADDRTCPTPHCGRDKRTGDLLCRRCWYVLPDNLKQPYQAARTALDASRTRDNAAAVLAAKKNILESIRSEGPAS